MKLLPSLRAYDWNEEQEIMLQESNIALNIDEALYNLFFIGLTLEKLFPHQDTGLRSASLYWRDNQYAVRTIGPDHIVGIGEKASTL